MSDDADLLALLSRHTPFGGWTDLWAGVPLAFNAYVGDELPPRRLVGSVRAVVLRGDEVLAVGEHPVLCVGGRPEPGETIEQTLHREATEESGWRVRSLGVIGFTHATHTDAQRPDWNRPAPDFIDPFFAVEAVEHVPTLAGVDEMHSVFRPIAEVLASGIDPINRGFLRRAVEVRSRL